MFKKLLFSSHLNAVSQRIQKIFCLFSALFLIQIIFISPLLAAKVSGRVLFESNGNAKILMDGFQGAYNLKSKTNNLNSQIKNLSTDDFISGYGQIKWVEKTVVMNSIQFVGLSRLIGQWKSNGNDVFRFENFQTLIFQSGDSQILPSSSLSAENNNSPGSLTSPPAQINYQISPRREDGAWPILLITQYSVEVGQINFDDSQTKLYIFNMRNGDISREYILSPESH